MSVCIRLSRYGRTHRPYFRVVAIDKRCHREGMSNEIVGYYDPQLSEKNLQVNMERVNAWVARGARISPSLTNLLKFYEYTVPAKTVEVAKKPAAKKAAPKPTPKKTFVAASRRAVNNHQATLKAARKVESAKKLAAHAATKAAKAAEAKPAEAAPEAPKA